MSNPETPSRLAMASKAKHEAAVRFDEDRAQLNNTAEHKFVGELNESNRLALIEGGAVQLLASVRACGEVMTNTKFTPGPWNTHRIRVIERSVKINEHVAIRPDGGPTFAYLPAGRNDRLEIQEANAALIAAAPDLFEALKSWVGCHSLDGALQVPDDVMREQVTRARAILAKAAGEKS